MNSLAVGRRGGEGAAGERRSFLLTMPAVFDQAAQCRLGEVLSL